MENKDERYLNITLKNDEDDKSGLSLSFASIIRNLKRFFVIWVVAAIVSGLISFIYSTISYNTNKEPLTALISFTYPGVEKGHDPAGNTFDVNSVKSPVVIEAALSKLGRPLGELESIRQNITFEGIIPSDVIDRMSAYKSIYESGSGSALSAAESMLETSYYPTQYKVIFDYSSTNFDSSEAVQILNTTLECYRYNFIEKYGYNKALGNAATAIDYKEYDYAEAVDVFSSTLDTLKTYVNQMAKDDSIRFRSNTTGYTFTDLSEALETIQSINLDVISSYINVNNVTKDKESLSTYYKYRINALQRTKNVYEEQLSVISDSIDNYQKDTVVMMTGTDGNNATMTQSSQEYDNLINKRIDTQTALSSTKQKIKYYQDRTDAIKDKPAATSAQMEKVDEDLKALNEKINKIIDDINVTANEYYESVAFKNAYNILVPASSSVTGAISDVLKHTILPFAIFEAIVFVIYISAAFIRALITENRSHFNGTEVKKIKSNEVSDKNSNNKESKK